MTRSLSTIFLKTCAARELEFSLTHDFPNNFPTWGSIGNEPNKGILTISASDSPPPLLKMFVQSEQCGQINLKIQNAL